MGKSSSKSVGNLLGKFECFVLIQKEKRIMQNIGLLFFRVSISLIMVIYHGWPKLLRLFLGNEIKFFDPFGIGATASLGLAVFAEFILSILIIFGILTRISSINLIITMFVAAFLYHADDPFKTKEKSILFLISYITLFFTGPGKYSLKSFFDKKIKSTNKILKFILS